MLLHPDVKKKIKKKNMATLSLIGSTTAGYKIWAAVVSVLFVVLGKISWKLDCCSGKNKTPHPAATSRPRGAQAGPAPGVMGRGAPPAPPATPCSTNITPSHKQP